MATIDEIADLLRHTLFTAHQSKIIRLCFEKILAVAGGAITVKENNVDVSTTITKLDFGAGFDVTESPAGEANVALDLTEDAIFLDLDARVTVAEAGFVDHDNRITVLEGAADVTDGDKGDITVSVGGTVWALDLNLATIDAPTASVNFAQQQATQLRIENRTSDPGSPLDGEIWLRTDL